MRKGQIKLLERAKRWNFKEEFIDMLSSEDKTLKQLDDLFYVMYCYKNADKEWIETYFNIDNHEIYDLIRLCKEKNIPITTTDLKQMTTVEDACTFFSKGDIICSSIFDIEVLLEIGYHSYSNKLLNIARLLRGENLENYLSDFRRDYRCKCLVKELSKSINERNSDDILNELDIDSLNRNRESYLEECIYNHSPIKIKSAKGIPEDIKKIDFKGYHTTIRHFGHSRYVNYSVNAIFITYNPYNEIIVDNGRHIPRSDGKPKKLIFSYKTEDFITGYKTKSDYKYRPTQLRELYEIISVCDDGSDKQNADNIVDFLCKKYDTFIFKDLYRDFLDSNGLLLPLLISEAGQYKTKQDLFEKHYKNTLKGNWNKKNANLTYILIKLNKRMTDAALARAMQCKKAPQVRKVGKKRCVMLYILYETIYNVTKINGSGGNSLLLDGLNEEYAEKSIKLLPINQTINQHNARHNNVKVKKAHFRIKKETKFKKLIDNMPDNYELIKTPKRLELEAELQHNCVAGYDTKINSDNCMIYSVQYENIRHTIEIIKQGSDFKIAQCYRACNQSPIQSVLTDLNNTIKHINQIQDNK